MYMGAIDKAVSLPPLLMTIVAIDRLAITIMQIWSSLRLNALFRVAQGLNFCHLLTEIRYLGSIQSGHSIAFGPNRTLGAMSAIYIGSQVRIPEGAGIETAGLDLSTGRPYKHRVKPIVCEDSAWFGSIAIVLGGVTVSANAIAGVCEVFTKDVPSNAKVAGTPTKHLCRAS